MQRLFKDVFNIAQDADFIIHEPVVREEVYSYEYEDGPGPDLKNLTFDLRNGSKTPWNSKIIDLLLEEIQKDALKSSGHSKGQRRISEKYFTTVTSACVRSGRPRSPRLQRRVYWRPL